MYSDSLKLRIWLFHFVVLEKVAKTDMCKDLNKMQTLNKIIRPSSWRMFPVSAFKSQFPLRRLQMILLLHCKS